MEVQQELRGNLARNAEFSRFDFSLPLLSALRSSTGPGRQRYILTYSCGAQVILCSRSIPATFRKS